MSCCICTIIIQHGQRPPSCLRSSSSYSTASVCLGSKLRTVLYEYLTGVEHRTVQHSTHYIRTCLDNINYTAPACLAAEPPLLSPLPPPPAYPPPPRPPPPSHPLTLALHLVAPPLLSPLPNGRVHTFISLSSVDGCIEIPVSQQPSLVDAGAALTSHPLPTCPAWRTHTTTLIRLSRR